MIQISLSCSPVMPPHMVWEQSCPIRCKMGQRSQLGLPQEPCQQQKRNTLNSIKKPLPLCLEYLSFTSTCTVENSPCTQITDLSLIFFIPVDLYHRWPHLVCNDGLSFSAVTSMIFVIKLAKIMVISRLPLNEFPLNVPIPGDVVLVMDHLDTTPVNARSIKSWTDKDPVLSTVRRYILHGWPISVPEENLIPFSRRRNELSVQDGCILWGSRVVIPPPGRDLILTELHQTHPGISQMKSLARGYVWWPCMDSDLEAVVKSCTTCQSSRHNPPSAPVHPWHWPEQPWSRIHVDYAGPFLGKTFLIIIDAHSKWLDVHMTNSSSSLATIEKLRSSFATFGIPKVIVTDNGTSFTSKEFQMFVTQNGISHLRSAPNHPATNGLAERAVQTFKEGMMKMSGPLETRLAKFLFHYRITPQTSTGVSPAQMLFGRPLRSRLDLVFPDVGTRIQKEPDPGRVRTFLVSDRVWCRDFTRGKWIPGEISKTTGPLSYEVQLENGNVVRRHVDQLFRRTTEQQSPSQPSGIINPSLLPSSVPRRSH